MISAIVKQANLQYSEILERYEKLKSLFLLSATPEFVNKYSELLNEKIIYESRRVQQQKIILKAKGRGGNSISQNIKKCMISLLKKNLKRHIYQRYEKECIEKHQIRSQKENIIILFLYLYKYLVEGLIKVNEIQKLTILMRDKIQKYINNSKKKISFEEERKDFHLENICQFQKYLHFDLDFNKVRTFEQVADMIHVLYRKKRNEYEKGIKRIKGIIIADSFLVSLFSDLSVAKIQDQDKFSHNEDAITKHDLYLNNYA